ncbi:hypothetical protein ACFV2N_25615 [Streptomyces sp. NPDC059680]|uniref:hypothetical protein n=1 Tax=Streptomyces sp. NPDC059680 TaxID=3346904 RepID=UPI00367D7EA3
MAGGVGPLRGAADRKGRHEDGGFAKGGAEVGAREGEFGGGERGGRGPRERTIGATRVVQPGRLAVRTGSHAHDPRGSQGDGLGGIDHPAYAS